MSHDILLRIRFSNFQFEMAFKGMGLNTIFQTKTFRHRLCKDGFELPCEISFAPRKRNSVYKGSNDTDFYIMPTVSSFPSILIHCPKIICLYFFKFRQRHNTENHSCLQIKWRNFWKFLHTTESCQNSCYLSEGTSESFCTQQKVVKTLVT